MGLRLKLLLIGVFLLSTLGSSRAKNATVEVVGLMHCTDCIKNRSSSSSNSSLGFEVLISCNANEMRARGNGGVDEHGKFNVTLSAEIAPDSGAVDGCYAKLQSRSGAPCRIQAAQTASVKILSNSTVAINRPTVIKFSPITCQSAFFWPFPNLTFFGSSPPAPPEYTPPPPSPVASPVQSPLPPPRNATLPPPQPSYDPPAPFLPPPVIEGPSPPPAPPPTYQNPTNPRIRSPSPAPQAPPPQLPTPPTSPVYSRPSPLPAVAPPLNGPIQSPIPPRHTPNPTPPPTVIVPAPSTPASSAPPPLAPPPTAGISIPPQRRRPSPIPKAPPIPRLPLTPSVPRKYFNPPKSRSKPPR